MKKLCKALALTLCIIMLLSAINVSGDPGVKTLLTLEEAKKLALEDDTQYKLQQSYIEQKAEDYDDIFDMYDGEVKGKFRNLAEKAEAEINNEMAIQNAYFAYKKEVFKKGDLKRKSDYEVTTIYYNVMKSKLVLNDANRSLDLAKNEFDIGKIKYELGLITKTSLNQIENSYKSAKTAYDKAAADVQNNMDDLGKSISIDFDTSNVEIDMTISIPDIKALDFIQIKKDYMYKNESYYYLSEQLSLALFKKEFAQTKYDEYIDKMSRNSDAGKALEDLLSEAKRDYNDTKYQYDENIKDLELTLNTQFSAINTLAETIENLQKNVENAKVTFAMNEIKYELGLISRNDLKKNESSLRDFENQLSTNIINLNTQYLALTQYSYTTEN